MTIEALNHLDRGAFTEALGWVFEHSTWVAERAWEYRPFTNLGALHEAMSQQVLSASRDEQLLLLRAHPDLGERAAMSSASSTEQSGAGLNQLTTEEFSRLQSANTAYKDKFGFPFLYAVKGSTKWEILSAVEARLQLDWDSEFHTALQQVLRIAGFRLQDLIR